MKTKLSNLTEDSGEKVTREIENLKGNFASGILSELDVHLTLRSFLTGQDVHEVDEKIYTAIKNNKRCASFICSTPSYFINLARWWKWLASWMNAENTNQETRKIKKSTPVEKGSTTIKTSSSISAEDTMFLPGAEWGKVVTRFPPEPSGYLHIGHAKAALLNDYFAHRKYGPGRLILRYDDTNPLKETGVFEESIGKDLQVLNVIPDTISHTSDYFDQLYSMACELIRRGRAYADDTSQEVMRSQRMKGIASSKRTLSADESLSRLEAMKLGLAEAQGWTLRAKISVDDPNKALRDPVIYRSVAQGTIHHRTGDKWKIYPTYDFCCPIVDSIEGVTHALRTSEYHDRDPQYSWFQDALGLRKVTVWDFSRMNFVRTLLSKRKLTRCVESRLVWGWDDPRMPTIQGILRRGMQIDALREFILTQGASKNIVNLDWTSFWSINKRYIDPLAARYTMIEGESEQDWCKVHVSNIEPGKVWSEQKDFHAKYTNLGKKCVTYSSNLIIERADANTFVVDEEITLMNWGNAFVRQIERNADSGNTTRIVVELHLSGDVKKTKKKITWLSLDQDLAKVEAFEFDYLLTKDKLGDDDDFEEFLSKESLLIRRGVGDVNVWKLTTGSIMQFDRKGYFRVDKACDKDGSPGKFFMIPTGKK